MRTIPEETISAFYDLADEAEQSEPTQATIIRSAAWFADNEAAPDVPATALLLLQRAEQLAPGMGYVSQALNMLVNAVHLAT